MECIEIDGYDTRLVKGQVKVYAIKGKKEYEIPIAFKDMCDEQHLAIAKAQTVMDELFNTSGEYYVPLRTGARGKAGNRRPH